MIEKILHSGAKIIRNDGPALDWNRHPELMLFVALTTQRNEIDTLGQRELKQWPRDRRERRSLIETSVETMQNDVYSRNANRHAHARAGCILCKRTMKAREPHTT